MSTSKSNKKKLILHDSSAHYNDWISSDSFSCVCVHARHQELQVFGAWHSSNMQERASPHFTTPMFLNEYATTLRYKRTGKHTSVQQSRVATCTARKVSVGYQFEHEASIEHHIEAYRESKCAVNDIKEEKPRQKQSATGDECPLCTAREILKDANPKRQVHSPNIRILPPPLIGYRGTNGVYFEPFYPALYGQSRGKHDQTFLGETNKAHSPMSADLVDRDNHWIPGNAVYQFQQHNRHSYYNTDNADTFLDAPVRKSGTISRGFTRRKTRSTAETTEGQKTEKTTITNFRTLSGRPVALVQERRSSLHSAITDRFFLEHGTAEVNESRSSSLETASVKESSKEHIAGKLLQGKLRTLSTLQTMVDPDFVVESTTFKQFQAQSTEPKLIKAKLKPLKQDSVESIPHRHSAKANLPNLEGKPPSSLSTIPSRQRSKHEQDPSEKKLLSHKDSDIFLTSPAVVNQTLESKIHTSTKEEFPGEPNPLRALQSLSSRLKPSPPTSSYLRSWISNNSSSKKNPFLLPPAKKSMSEKDLLYKTVNDFGVAPFRYKMVSLRKDKKVDEVDVVVEEHSRCALRSQKRRQRQQRRLLSGQSNKKASRLVDEMGHVCVKKRPSKCKVYVRGRAKTLVDFLPTEDIYTSQLPEALPEALRAE